MQLMKLFNSPLTSDAILISSFSALSDNFDLGPPPNIDVSLYL